MPGTWCQRYTYECLYSSLGARGATCTALDLVPLAQVLLGYVTYRNIVVVVVVVVVVLFWRYLVDTI